MKISPARYMWIRLTTLAALAAIAGSAAAQDPAPPARAKKVAKKTVDQLMELQRSQDKDVLEARALAQQAMNQASDARTKSLLSDLDKTLAALQTKLSDSMTLLAKESPESLDEASQKAVDASRKRGQKNRALIKADHLAQAGQYQEAIDLLKPYQEAEPGDLMIETRIKNFTQRLTGPKDQNVLVEYVKLRTAAVVLEETGTVDNLKLALDKWKKIRELDPSYAAEADLHIKDLEPKVK